MSETTDLPDPEDLLHVNIDEDWNLDYWTTTLGVSRDELVAAVRTVGSRAKDVEEYLDRRKGNGQPAV